MSAEPGLIDANIIIYAMDSRAATHVPCRVLLEAAHEAGTTLYVTSQILCEFYSVVTNPRRVAVPRSPAEALSVMSNLLALPGIHLLPTPASAVAGWMALLERRPVRGSDVFDLQIVATMQANGVQRIYTFNTKDFDMFPELIVIAPGQIS